MAGVDRRSVRWPEIVLFQNFFMSTDWHALKVFASIKSFSLLPGSVFGSNTG